MSTRTGTNRSAVGVLIANIAALQQRLGERVELGKPASASTIKAVERDLGLRCPPSLRELIEQANGADNLSGWSMRAWGGPKGKKMERYIRETRKLNAEMFEHGVHLEEGDDADIAAAWAKREKQEKRDRSVIHPTRHPVIGCDWNGSLLVLDRCRVRKNGEPEVAIIDNQQQCAERHRDLVAFLESVQRELRDELGEEERPKPDPRLRTAASKSLQRLPTTKRHRLASFDEGGSLRLWDLAKRRATSSIRMGFFNSVARCGSLFAGVTPDHELELWDVSKKAKLGTWKKSGSPFGVELGDKGILLSIADHEETSARAEWLNTGAVGASLALGESVYCSASLAGGEQVVVGGRNRLEVYDVRTAKRLHRQSVNGDVLRVVGHPDGKSFVFFLNPPSGAGVLVLRRAQRTITLGRFDVLGHAPAMAFSPRGDLIVGATSQSGIAAFQGLTEFSETGRIARTIPRQAATSWSIAVSPDARWLAECGPEVAALKGRRVSWRASRTIRIVDLASGLVAAELKGHATPVRTVFFVPA